MNITESDLEKRYQELSTEALLELKVQGTLTEMAAMILEKELKRREVSIEERKSITTEIQVERQKQDEMYQRLAPLSVRLLAQIIDTLIAFAILLAGFKIALMNSFFFHTCLSLALAYLWLADAFPRGQSIGKIIMGISVVDIRTNHPCSIRQSLIRNIFLTIFGIIDWFPLLTRNGQRLGDVVAKTIVVKLNRP
jgi:uncharacterized RDD family membrane protein YckC